MINKMQAQLAFSWKFSCNDKIDTEFGPVRGIVACLSLFDKLTNWVNSRLKVRIPQFQPLHYYTNPWELLVQYFKIEIGYYCVTNYNWIEREK